MLELSRVTAGYGRHEVLTEVDLNLREPGLYLVLGANGSGKSTLLKVASGRLRPRQGQVRLDGVQLYRLFGDDVPYHEFVSFGAIPDSDASLLEMYRLKLEAVGRGPTLTDFIRGYDVPWTAKQFVRVRGGMLSTSEKSELLLLLGLAASPRFLFVDEVFSQCGRDVTERMTGNLQRWSNATGGLALVASTRYGGYMDVFAGCFVLSEGKLRPLPGSTGKMEAAVQLAGDPIVGTASQSRDEREVSFVFGEYFYRHQRVAWDNPHFELEAVLENALLVRLKGTLDGALAYLREMGLDPVRIELMPSPSDEDSAASAESSES